MRGECSSIPASRCSRCRGRAPGRGREGIRELTTGARSRRGRRS
jgi:hypothetical protein